MHQANKRRTRGQTIATAKRAVRRINKSRYLVQSQSGKNKYEVRLTNIGWVCSCADHKFRGVKCKHIYAVDANFPIRETVEPEVVIQQIDRIACRYCNSEHMVKKAVRHNKQ